MRASCLRDWRGGWVDEGAPAPYAATAAAVRKEIIPTQADSQRQMCGSPRHRSWQWRWRSSDARCPFATPTREQLCARLAGKRIVLYGDSLTHQFFASLESLAGNATLDPARIEYRQRLDQVNEFCKHEALPDQLRARLRGFFRSTMGLIRATRYERLLRMKTLGVKVLGVMFSVSAKRIVVLSIPVISRMFLMPPLRIVFSAIFAFVMLILSI